MCLLLGDQKLVGKGATVHAGKKGSGGKLRSRSRRGWLPWKPRERELSEGDREGQSRLCILYLGQPHPRPVIAESLLVHFYTPPR